MDLWRRGRAGAGEEADAHRRRDASSASIHRASQPWSRLRARLLQSGKVSCPGIAATAHRIAALEQRRHVFLVERLIRVLVEIGGDAGKVELDAALPRHRIDPVEVADALVLDQ